MRSRSAHRRVRRASRVRSNRPTCSRHAASRKEWAQGALRFTVGRRTDRRRRRCRPRGAPADRRAHALLQEALDGTLLAAMSGGVDSSVATALAVAAGPRGRRRHAQAVGVRRRGDPADEGVQHARRRRRRAACRRRASASRTTRSISASVFAREVVDPFVDDYARGTHAEPVRPLQRARAVRRARSRRRRCSASTGSITGHYARTADGRLFRARNADKDQSYVLYAIGDVRRRARALPARRHREQGRGPRDGARSSACRTPTATDSLEVCFVGEGRRPGDVVAERIPVAVRSGPIVDRERERRRRASRPRVLHGRAAQGPRRGGHAAATSTEIDPERNALVVDDADGLGSESTRTRRVRASSAIQPADGTILSAVVRYRGEEIDATFTTTHGRLRARVRAADARGVARAGRRPLRRRRGPRWRNDPRASARPDFSRRPAARRSRPRRARRRRRDASACRSCVRVPDPGRLVYAARQGVFSHDLETGARRTARELPGRHRGGDAQPGRDATSRTRPVPASCGLQALEDDRRFQVAAAVHRSAGLVPGRTADRRRARCRIAISSPSIPDGEPRGAAVRRVRERDRFRCGSTTSASRSPPTKTRS